MIGPGLPRDLDLLCPCCPCCGEPGGIELEIHDDQAGDYTDVGPCLDCCELQSCRMCTIQAPRWALRGGLCLACSQLAAAIPSVTSGGAPF